MSEEKKDFSLMKKAELIGYIKQNGLKSKFSGYSRMPLDELRNRLTTNTQNVRKSSNKFQIAIKQYCQTHNRSFFIPSKGSDEYNEIKKIQNGLQ